MGKGKRNRQLHLEDNVGAPEKRQNKNKKQFVMPKWAKIAICAVLLVAIIGGIVAAAIINSGIVYRNRIIVESKSGKFDINQQMATFILWQTVYQQAYYEYSYVKYGIYQDTNKILENYLDANDYAVLTATSYVSNYLKSGINSMQDYLIEMVASADAALNIGLELEAHDKEEAKAYVQELQSYYAQFRNTYVNVYTQNNGILPSTGLWGVRANLAMATFQNFLNLSVGEAFKSSDIEKAAKLMIMYSKYSDYKSLEFEDQAGLDDLQDFILRHPAGHFETKYFSFTGAEEAMIRNFFTDKFMEERFESTVAKHYANADRLVISELKGDALTAKLEELGLNAPVKYTKSTNDEGEASYSPDLVEDIGEFIFSASNKLGTFSAISGEKCAYLIYFKETSTTTEATIAFKEYKYEDYKDKLVTDVNSTDHATLEAVRDALLASISSGKNTTSFLTDNEKAKDLLAQLNDSKPMPEGATGVITKKDQVGKEDVETPQSILNTLYAKDAKVNPGWNFTVNNTTESYVVTVNRIIKDVETNENTTDYEISYYKYTDDFFAAVLTTFEAEFNLYLLETKIEAPTYSMTFDAFEEKVINWLLDENLNELILKDYANKDLDALLAAMADSQETELPKVLGELFDKGIEDFEKSYETQKRFETEYDSDVYDYIFNSKNKDSAIVIIGEDDRVFLVYVAPVTEEEEGHEGHDHNKLVHAAIKEYVITDYEADLKVSDAEDAKTFREQLFADLRAEGRKDTTDFKSADDLAKEELDAINKKDKTWPTSEELLPVGVKKPTGKTEDDKTIVPDAIINKIYPDGKNTTKVNQETLSGIFQVNDNGTSYLVKVVNFPASDDDKLTCKIQYLTFEDSEYYSYFRAIQTKLNSSLQENSSSLKYPESITDGSYQDWLFKGEYVEAKDGKDAAHVFDRQKDDLTFIANTDSKNNVTSLTIYIIDKVAEQVKDEELVVYGGYLSFSTEKEANKAYKKLQKEAGFSLIDKFTALTVTTEDEHGHESVTSATVNLAIKKSTISDENLKNWLFDANRKKGDLAVVASKDGKSFYLVTFMSSEQTWLRTAKTDWTESKITDHLKELVKNGGYTFNEDSMAKIEDVVTTTTAPATTTKP